MENGGVYAEQYGEDGYMEQEEEWEREGLLDPAWEKQQKKVSFYAGQINTEKNVCATKEKLFR